MSNVDLMLGVCNLPQPLVESFNSLYHANSTISELPEYSYTLYGIARKEKIALLDSLHTLKMFIVFSNNFVIYPFCTHIKAIN